MDLIKKRKDSRLHSKKDKKLKKLISKSDSDSDESEHELSYYLNDRVKLMKEVLKIIKPKKIKTMAPECIKNLDNEEINSMLLEELLGISNKRLKYIFNGQNLEEDSSSTDPEVEKQPIDVISLDDITDDDFIIDLDSDNDGEKKRHKKHSKIKIKEECKRKKIKKEKQDKVDHFKTSKKHKDEPNKDKMNEQNLMSVLELLELQARARAIRSQLALENNKKGDDEQGKTQVNENKTAESDHDDAIIIESPKNIEIVITSSESENEESLKNSSKNRGRSTACENSHSEGTNLEEAGKDNGETVTETSNTKEPESGQLKDDSDINKPSLIENNGQNKHSDLTAVVEENEVKKICENGNLETGNNSTEGKKSTEKNNKITNIETVIISPAKTSVIDSNTEIVQEISNNTDLETEEVNAEDKKSKSENGEVVENDSNKLQISEAQAIIADESDGIIINMEQSEIDCIISD